MKKVLLAIPGNSSFYKPSVITFKQLGWEVKNVDYRKLDISAVGKNHIRLIKPGSLEMANNWKHLSLKRIINNQEILRVTKQWKPDLFMTFKGEIILPETVDRLRKAGIKTVNWFPDHLPENKVNLKFLSAFDVFVYWDKWRTNKYHKQGLNNVFYLPFCTIPEKTFAPKNKTIPINFVANWQAHREVKITPVANLGLKIWGGKQWAQSGLANYYRGGPVTVPEMIGIIRKSKITLNIHVVEQIYSEGTNIRTFEATGAGGFLLANRRKCLEELFKVGKEIEVFDTKEELVEKTRFYLKNDTSREKISRAGWERAKKEHSYTNRFKELIKHLNEK